jgi:hypothetical protein
MNGSPAKKVVGAFIAACALMPLLSSCGAAAGAMGAASDVTGGAVGGKCPDVTKPESILAFDYVGNFHINAEAATKLKGAVAASVEIKGFADQIDADLKTACGGIAKDLGAGANFTDGKTACDAALKAMNDTKVKIGAKAKIAVIAKEPVCHADMAAYGDCAGKCDVKASGGSAKIECEPGKLSGECTAECSGSCDLKASAKCEGTCEGTCDAEIKGGCSGKCNGKCDGATSSGATCAGTCEGKCEGGSVKAECKGKCGGSCKLAAKAKCEGTCNGSCSAEMKAPKCNGEVKPPQMSADCKAHCDASISAKAECTPPKVGIAITGAADAKAAEQFKVALENNLGLVLKVAVGMGERSIKMAGNVSAVIDGVQASIKDIAASAGGKAALTTGQLTACFAETFKGAASAAGSLKANVSVSASVSASASGSASTK